MKRLVKLNTDNKTYQGPWLSPLPLDGFVEESAAIQQGFRQTDDKPSASPLLELWRIRAALELLGFMARVQSYITAQPEAERIVLENLTEYYVDPVDTNSAIVRKLFTCLTDAEYDKLVRTAQSISV